MVLSGKKAWNQIWAFTPKICIGWGIVKMSVVRLRGKMALLLYSYLCLVHVEQQFLFKGAVCPFSEIRNEAGIERGSL